MTGRVKVIFLDWDGTISRSRFWQQWRDSGDRLEVEKYEKIQKVLFHGHSAELFESWMLGKVSAEQVVNYLAGSTGIPEDELLTNLKSSCENVKVEPRILPAVRKARRRGMKVFIATDNMDSFSRWTVPALGLKKEFDGILNSAEIGAFKKDISPSGESQFFNDILRRLKVAPSETILIDDNPDTKIVESFGMRFRQAENITQTAGLIEDIRS